MGSQERLASSLHRVNACFREQPVPPDIDDAIFALLWELEAATSDTLIPVTSAIGELCGHLAKEAAAAKRLGPAAPYMLRSPVGTIMPSLLGTVVDLICKKMVVLSEADIMRALTAVDFVSKYLPKHVLDIVMALVGAQQRNPDTAMQCEEPAGLTFMGSAASTLHTLWRAVHTEGVLPARVVRLLLANQLKPDNLRSWLDSTSSIVQFASQTILHWNCPSVLLSFWCDLLADSASPIAVAVKQRLELQERLLQVAVSVLSAHSSSLPCLDDAEALDVLGYSLRLASTSCLAGAREALATRGNPLTAYLTSLVTHPVLLECESPALGSVLIGSLQLGAVLSCDALRSTHQSVPAFVRQLDILLPVLHRLAAQVAAAAPMHSAGTTGSGSAVPAAGAAAENSFAQLCWGPLAGEWATMFKHWAACFKNRSMPGMTERSVPLLATLRVTQLLLRLVPLLPLQPLATPGNLVLTAAKVSATEGGAAAVRDGVGRHEGSMPVHALVLLADELPVFADSLLDILQHFSEENGPYLYSSHTLVAFYNFSTACQYAHAVHAVLAGQPTGAAAVAGGSCGAEATLGSLFADPREAACQAARVVDAAFQAWIFCQTLPAGARVVQGSALQLRLQRQAECMVLLHLSTLPALPLGHMPNNASAFQLEQMRCLSLLRQLEAEGLQSFWQQLLQEPAQGPGTGVGAAAQPPGSSGSSSGGGGSSMRSAAGSGSSALSLLLGIAQNCLQVLMGYVYTNTQLAQSPGLKDALRLMSISVQHVPAAAASTLQHQQLLLALKEVVSRLLTVHRNIFVDKLVKQEAGKMLLLVRGLLLDLAAHQPSSKASLLSELPGGTDSDGEVVGRNLDAFLTAAIERLEAGNSGVPLKQQLELQQQEQQQSPNPHNQQNQLVVRCYQALSLRSCSNMRCPNLAADPSGVPAKGRLCSGCRVARYCGAACSQADWRQHRAACRLLRQEAVGG